MLSNMQRAEKIRTLRRGESVMKCSNSTKSNIKVHWNLEGTTVARFLVRDQITRGLQCRSSTVDGVMICRCGLLSWFIHTSFMPCGVSPCHGLGFKFDVNWWITDILIIIIIKSIIIFIFFYLHCYLLWNRVAKPLLLGSDFLRWFAFTFPFSVPSWPGPYGIYNYSIYEALRPGPTDRRSAEYRLVRFTDKAPGSVTHVCRSSVDRVRHE